MSLHDWLSVAPHPNKIVATHQLSSSPNLGDGEIRKTRKGCANMGVDLSLNHNRVGRGTCMDMDFCIQVGPQTHS